MNYYIFISTIIFFFLAMIWNRKDWLNFFIKFGFVVLSIAGGLLSLQILGFIVKV
jgi:hypothetical protein